jgi:probable selenium-dependent hydroxylase accessory protein YqeC
MTLIKALSIEPGDCVAAVGAGGKTTLCWRLVQEIAALGQRAIFTTTTKIWQPAPGAFDVMRISPHPLPLPTREGSWRTACLAASVDGAVNFTPINGAYMPTVHTKLNGYTSDEICDLKLSILNSQFSILVEADGARGLRIKAPGDGEPVIPACADVVCVLANLDAIGRPLDDRIAHRVDRVAWLTQTMPGTIITASLIANLLSHPEGGSKGIPPSARKVAVLTQQDDTAPHPDAARMMDELVQRGFDQAAFIALRTAQPVLATR